MKYLAKSLSLCLLITCCACSVFAINSEKPKAGGPSSDTFDIRHTMAAVAQLMGISGVSTAKSFGDGAVTSVYTLRNAKPSAAAFRLRQIFLGKGVTIESDEVRKSVVIVAPHSLSAQLKSEMAKIDSPRG